MNSHLSITPCVLQDRTFFHMCRWKDMHACPACLPEAATLLQLVHYPS